MPSQAGLIVVLKLIVTAGYNQTATVFKTVATVESIDDIPCARSFNNQGNAKFPQRNALRLYPNPTSELVNITFDLEAPGSVSLEMFDGTGRKIKTLFCGTLDAGGNRLSVDLGILPAGLYSLHFHSDTGTKSLLFSIFK